MWISVMELVFKSTRQFDKDLKKFSHLDRTFIVETINQYAQFFATDATLFYQKVYRPVPINLKDGLESSLYVLKVQRYIRIILTVDEDPIFDQVIFTLIRTVHRENLEKAFLSMAKSLYQSEITSP